jgi:DNA-binding transcriptional LysR family regulator
MDVHLRDLRYFLAVAEEQSFTRAAAELYVSQPVLSKQIRRLEQVLRVRLLHRDSRGVKLTAAGSALLVEVRRMLTNWDGVLPAVIAADSSEQRVVRVSMQTSIGRDLYPAILDRFARARPDWRVALKLSDWTDPSSGLLGHGADAALIWLPAPAGIDVQVLLREPRWVALPGRHPLTGQDEVDFADLWDEPFIALPELARPMREFWLAVDERRGRPARIAMEATNPDETFEAVASGLGVHLLPAGNTEIYARPGIVFRPVRGLTPCELAVAWRQGDRRPEVAAFRMACAEAASGLDTFAVAPGPIGPRVRPAHFYLPAR